jgi:hypothetical protein
VLWLNPTALFALTAVAAPILIHILIQRRAERLPFPTLRFLQPTRLAAIRRHILDDIVLLAVRVALLTAAVAALAGPLLVTTARRQAWDRRIVRAIVTDTVGAERPRGRPGRLAPPTEDLRSFLAPGRHASRDPGSTRRARAAEIVIAPVSDRVDRASDIAAIPPASACVSSGPARSDTQTVPAGRLLTSGGVRAREVTLTAIGHRARRPPGSDGVADRHRVVEPTSRRSTRRSRVLSQRVWAAPPDRRPPVLVEPNMCAGLQACDRRREAECSHPASAAASPAAARSAGECAGGALP